MSSEPSIFFADTNERQGSFLRRTFVLGGLTTLGGVALLGVARLLRGLLLESDAVPPQSATVTDAAGKAVGNVTSSCRSLSLHKPIALAYLKTAAAAPNQQVTVVWPGASATARVVELPFTQAPAD